MPNKLSRSIDKVPTWMIQTLLGIMLTSLLGWATWTTATAMSHDTKIAVVTTRVDTVDKSLVEIKDLQKETIKRLDTLIDRRK